MDEQKEMIVLPSNGAIDIVDWIKQQAERWGIPVAQEAAQYMLSEVQCQQLGIPKQEKRSRQ